MSVLPRRSPRAMPGGGCLAAGLFILLGCSRPAVVRPSLLLVTIDTLRADHLGCYGYRRPTSPRIDRLAAEGALFTRVTTSLPRTTPSVASILTGRYPKGHGARGLFYSLSRANLTLAEVMKEAGYDTAAVVSNLFLRPGQGFEQGFDYYDDPAARFDGDSAAAITTTALRWLRGRDRGRPYFLWVHYLDPHWTYQPDPPFDRAYDPGFHEPFTLYDDLAAGRLTKGQVIFRDVLSDRQVEHVVALYDGEIAQVDAALAPLLDEVEGAGAGPVLIVLTSDHGESLGEHGYHFAHGEYLYEEGLHVPLLMAMSGTIPAGLRVEALAQNIDIAPTILGLLGIDRLQSVDGRPLLLPGGRRKAGGGASVEPAPGRSVVFAESDFQLIHAENRRFYIPGPAGKWSSASDGRYKVIQIPRHGDELIEFYDLASDPGETRDLERTGIERGARDRLLREVRKFVDYDAGRAPGLDEIDPEQRQRLKSLGYIN
jgi:arylsulfatase A-like enzyme